MSWTTPQTWSAVVVTVPDLNREIRDNMNALHGVVISQSANYAVSASDGHNVLVEEDASGGARTVTLYTAVGNAGALLGVKKVDSSANAVIVDPSGAETIDGLATWTLWVEGDYVWFMSNGATWRVLAERAALHMVTTSGTYAALVTDDVIEATSGTFTITLHAVSAVRRNRPLVVVNSGTGVITVARAGSDTIVGGTTVTLRQYSSIILIPQPAGPTWIIT